MVAPAGGDFAENLSWDRLGGGNPAPFRPVPTKVLADPRPARFVARRTDAPRQRICNGSATRVEWFAQRMVLPGETGSDRLLGVVPQLLLRSFF
jgi:hypothetical protein